MKKVHLGGVPDHTDPTTGVTGAPGAQLNRIWAHVYLVLVTPTWFQKKSILMDAVYTTTEYKM